MRDIWAVPCHSLPVIAEALESLEPVVSASSAAAAPEAALSPRLLSADAELARLALARRLREKGLVAIRRAIFEGRIGSSMAELLARYATKENEAELLEEAARSTFRAMQAELTGKSPAQSDAEADADELRVRPVDGRARRRSRCWRPPACWSST